MLLIILSAIEFYITCYSVLHVKLKSDCVMYQVSIELNVCKYKALRPWHCCLTSTTIAAVDLGASALTKPYGDQSI